MLHEDLVAKAVLAIDVVFSDKTVGISQTRDSLEELNDHISIQLESL